MADVGPGEHGSVAEKRRTSQNFKLNFCVICIMVLICKIIFVLLIVLLSERCTCCYGSGPGSGCKTEVLCRQVTDV